jgi:hypothetical protein
LTHLTCQITSRYNTALVPSFQSVIVLFCSLQSRCVLARSRSRLAVSSLSNPNLVGRDLLELQLSDRVVPNLHHNQPLGRRETRALDSPVLNLHHNLLLDLPGVRALDSPVLSLQQSLVLDPPGGHAPDSLAPNLLHRPPPAPAADVPAMG